MSVFAIEVLSSLFDRFYLIDERKSPAHTWSLQKPWNTASCAKKLANLNFECLLLFKCSKSSQDWYSSEPIPMSLHTGQVVVGSESEQILSCLITLFTTIINLIDSNNILMYIIRSIWLINSICNFCNFKIFHDKCISERNSPFCGVLVSHYLFISCIPETKEMKKDITCTKGTLLSRFLKA